MMDPKKADSMRIKIPVSCTFTFAPNDQPQREFGTCQSDPSATHQSLSQNKSCNPNSKGHNFFVKRKKL